MRNIKNYNKFLFEKREEDENEDHGLSDAEVEAINRNLEENLKRYQSLTIEIRTEQMKLQEKLDSQHKELNEIMDDVRDQMKTLNISTKKSDKVVAKLVKQYEKSSSMSYKKLWEKALEALNEENQKILINIQETSKVKHNIQEQFRIKVNERLSDVGNYVTAKFKEFLRNSKIKMKKILKSLHSQIKSRDNAAKALDRLL
jgi:DNA-binding ferritin-like protein